MIRSRLFWEIVAPFAVCGLVAGMLLVWHGGRVHRRGLEKALSSRLASTGMAIGTQWKVFEQPAERWLADLKRFAVRDEVRLSIISGDGTPLADTAVDAEALQNQTGRFDIQTATRRGISRGGESESGRIAVTVAVHQLPDGSIVAGGKSGLLIGFVRAAAPLAPIEAAVGRWRFAAAGLATIVGCAGLIWVGLVGYHLAGSLSALTAGIESSIDDGQPGPRRGTSRSLARLSAAFSDWAGQTSRRIARLGADNVRLRQESQRRWSILDGMAEGVIAVDANEVVLFANRAVTGLLDIPREKLLGRPLYETARIAPIQESIRSTLAGGETPQVEIEMPRSAIVVAARSRPLIDAESFPAEPHATGEPAPSPSSENPPPAHRSGRPPTGAVLVLHDITELRRLENIRREFVGNVSHELKTPLASIQAYTETLLDGAIHDDAHNVAFLQRIGEQAERLHALVVDLLRLARIEAGTDVFEIQKLTASQIIGPCIEEHAALARSRDLRLEAEPPGEAIRLQADPGGLQTILDNLLDNALHYTPAGGRVTVRWSRQGDMAVIDVIDTGIGIPPEHLQRIFERFHRVDKARSRDHGGTGLGLAIVKHMVQVFGGRIEVESRLDQGSQFRVYLPAA